MTGYRLKGFSVRPFTKPSPDHSTFSRFGSRLNKAAMEQIKKVYTGKGYAGNPNRDFLSMNNIADGIMRKDSTAAKITDYEIKLNKRISKGGHTVEEYF